MGLALASFLLRIVHPNLGAALLDNARRDSWTALMLNVSVMIGALSGLVMAYFMMGGRDFL